jgi:hypothetical protein
MANYITLKDVEIQDIMNFDNYCPISVKDENNPPRVNFLDAANNVDVFLSDKNVNHMISYIISLNSKYSTDTNLCELEKKIPMFMFNWVKKNDLNSYKYVYDNILETLEYINKKFIMDHSCLYINPDEINVYNSKSVIVSDCGKLERKNHNEMTADDYNKLNLWENRELYTYNTLNRYKNKLPAWRIGLSTRHYDRNNDGLHHAVSERASLNNQIHGYDMSNIIKGSTFYNNSDYL